MATPMGASLGSQLVVFFRYSDVRSTWAFSAAVPWQKMSREWLDNLNEEPQGRVAADGVAAHEGSASGGGRSASGGADADGVGGGAAMVGDGAPDDDDEGLGAEGYPSDTRGAGGAAHGRSRGARRKAGGRGSGAMMYRWKSARLSRRSQLPAGGT